MFASAQHVEVTAEIDIRAPGR